MTAAADIIADLDRQIAGMQRLRDELAAVFGADADAEQPPDPDQGRASAAPAPAAADWPPADLATVDWKARDQHGLPVWMTTSEVAYELARDETTVRRWARDRNRRCGVQVGGRWLIHRARLWRSFNSGGR